MKTTITACLIVKNEADHIRTVLESLKGVDEIVICDTGSEDDTVAIAKEYTDKVFIDYAWNDDFAEARNYAMSKCSSEWILSIDGDEKLETDIGYIYTLLTTIGNIEVKTFGVKMIGLGDHVHILQRLFRNDNTVHWVGAAHETLFPVQDNEINITIRYGYSSAHEKDHDRMMRILLKAIENGEKNPRNMYYLGREYYYKKDYENAITWFSQCVYTSIWNPEKSDAFLYLSRCYFYTNEGDQARAMCLEAININPDFKEALLFMADLHYEPWKHKWLEFSQLAKNENVLFIRN